MQVSLFLWLSSRLAAFSASAESNSSFTRAVGLFRATICFTFTILLPYTLFSSVPSHYVRAILFCEFMQTMYDQCHEGLCYGLY